jgi:hypothetical protein
MRSAEWHVGILARLVSPPLYVSNQVLTVGVDAVLGEIMTTMEKIDW